MSLFSSPKTIFWIKPKTVEVFFDKKDNNHFSFDLCLYHPLTDEDFQPLRLFIKKYHLKNISVLVGDDVVVTKSFLYDSKIDNIDKKEVIGLARDSVEFTIEPELLTFNLIKQPDKTVIQAHVFQPEKFRPIKTNIEQLPVTVESIIPTSSAIAQVISQFFTKDYFLIYPSSPAEYTLSLCQGNITFLTSQIKGSSIKIQKIINYSSLYFPAPSQKIFIPLNFSADLISNSILDKTQYDEKQLAQKFNKATNLPLPVLGMIITQPLQKDSKSSAIIKQSTDNNSKPPMETKKNILPIVAAFFVTAAVASIGIWFLLNRGSDSVDETLAPTPTQVIEILPTNTPIPTIAEISKKLKVQVLNATDINGQAATLKDKLSQLGFENITVGNSKEKVTSNNLRLKPSQASAAAYFKTKLGDFFETEVSPDLKENYTYDIVFIIGVNLSTGEPAANLTPTKATLSPTVKPTAKPTSSTTASPSASPTTKLTTTPAR